MTRTRILTFAGFLVLVLGAMAACSNGSDTDDASASAGASLYQQDLLADGVTYAEYERATLDTMSCLEREGIRVYGPYSEQGGRSLSFDYGGLDIDASPQQFQAEQAAFEGCFKEHLDQVARVYAESVELTETELQERELNRRRCVRDRGFDTSDDMDSGDFYPLVFNNFSELIECLELFP